MALRHRRMKEISRFLHIVYSGDSYQCCSQACNIADFSTMPKSSTRKPVTKRIRERGFHSHRFSTKAKLSRDPATAIGLLSFIKASLDEQEGTYHCWLNTLDKTAQLSRGDGIFLVLAARTLDHGVMFENLKKLKQRFPHLYIVGLQLIRSPADQEHLIQLLMTENITFPILLSKKTTEAVLATSYLKNLGVLLFIKRKTWILKYSTKQDGITKENYVCSSLQNLLLYYPGCISADESGNRIFLSDCNHHRIIIADGNGEILDCIGSSPGFEDGDFESAKLRRPAGSYYHAAEDCLYFVDSENHAIRKADMETRLVETLYPTSASNKGNVRIWTWIMNKLGFESSVESNIEKDSEVFDSNPLYFPWHLLKSVDDTLFILDRSFQTVWAMDLASAKIDEALIGSSENFEICRQQITKKLSLLDQVPSDWLQQQTENTCPMEGLPHSGLLSSMATLQNQIFICDTVGQRILKVNRESGVCSNFTFSNLGILGLPYWLMSPLETFYAVGSGLSYVPIDHLQSFQFLPGRIDIQLIVDVPPDTELVQTLDKACIWRQARGSATEVSGMEDVPGSTYKAGVSQQWYDELDDLASPKPVTDMADEDDKLDNNLMVDDKRTSINCCVNTSPGTSEVIIYAVLYLKLKKDLNSQEENRKIHAGRILDIMTSRRCGKTERDLCNAFLLKSKGDLRDLNFMKPLHVRIKLDCLDHPKAENGRDVILTDSSIEVKVSLN
ncbi:Protein SUPPRESSOR OF QUENCHING 1, chloroplastic isoform A [Senna tora]|uniref:Protein SUPPRESSOR OF QUENCHING 1, chloroplastic isoform A n=1 Tax=Senna tora TaxID=362788 RepID=A0A834WQK2_9FABA|nr:Protein SUPPRESSOR OF QUENCHING 1, chloroplastic isoform A [Senna tora]